MSDAPRWRPATEADLDAMMAIQDEVHAALLPERRDIFIDKREHFGDGFLVLEGCGRRIGYGIAHPWRLGAVPKLDTPFGRLPDEPDCLFVHDVALLPESRGQGAGRAFIRIVTGIALDLGLDALALVSVYGTVPVWARCGFRVVDGVVPADKLTDYGDTARYMVNRIGGFAETGAGPA